MVQCQIVMNVKKKKSRAKDQRVIRCYFRWGVAAREILSEEVVLNRMQSKSPMNVQWGTAFHILRTACTKALRQDLGLVCLKISKEAEMAAAHETREQNRKMSWQKWPEATIGFTNYKAFIITSFLQFLVPQLVP